MTAPLITASPVAWPSARTMAAAAALAVAISGRGDLVFVGGLLAVALADRRSAVAALLAVSAVAVRWGTTSADAITGAVTSLGPGVRVGPPHAAAALGLAAVALVLAGAATPLLPRLAAVATAGAVAVGPVAAGSVAAVAVGILALGLAALVTFVLPRLAPPPGDRVRRAAPVAAGVALALAVIW